MSRRNLTSKALHDSAEDATLARIQQLMAYQSYAFDSGQSKLWAKTFTRDGVFESPTYGAPVQGGAALEEFARRVHLAQPRMRHVLTNVCLIECRSAEDCTVMSTLLVLNAPTSHWRIDRVTTLTDHLTRSAEGWRIRSRRVEPA
jgi:hypothetical protein